MLFLFKILFLWCSRVQREISISRLRKLLPGFCQKFWSNFHSNFPNDDIVHRAQSEVPDVSQNFFTKYSSHILGFLLHIWDYQNISWIFMTCGSPGHPEQIVAFLSWSKFKSAAKQGKSHFSEYCWIQALTRVGGGVGGVKLLPFSFDLCQPQYFLRRRNMKGQIYTLLAGYFQRGHLQKWFLLILKGKLLGELHNIVILYFCQGGNVMTIRTRRTVAIRRSNSYLLVSNDLCQHW